MATAIVGAAFQSAAGPTEAEAIDGGIAPSYFIKLSESRAGFNTMRNCLSGGAELRDRLLLLPLKGR